jgi:hypothetical protein
MMHAGTHEGHCIKEEPMPAKRCLAGLLFRSQVAETAERNNQDKLNGADLTLVLHYKPLILDTNTLQLTKVN